MRADWFTRLLFLLLLCCQQAVAQVPQANNFAPAESFLGEQFCFGGEFSNTGNPGFGPHFQLQLPPELIFDSAMIFGSSAIIMPVGVFPAAPSNQLIDPLTNDPVTGNEGDSLTIVQLPVGSVVTGGPLLNVEFCLTIDPAAIVGVPLPISLTPVYQFGDTATGDNGPIVGTPDVANVTPTVIRFEKTNTAPEQERAPGPTWPYNYELTVDIANTATINPIQINDTLPANVQYIGPVSITGGSACSVTTEPSTLVPGGSVGVTCSGNTVGTTSDADVVVSFPVHVVDILDETSCGTVLLTNNATLDATYQPIAGPFPLPQLSDTSDVVAKHIAVQKGASPNMASPGDTITYTLNFQVTDFGDNNRMVLTDIMPDGVLFDAHANLIVGGVPMAIAPVVTPIAAGQTQVVYDIGAVAGVIPASTAITLSYTGIVQQLFSDTGEPVLASDSLTNNVVVDYDLVQGALACADISAATVGIIPIQIMKSVTNPQPFYDPGEVVTFRLEMSVPSGDTSAINFIDTFPLPVFDVNSIDLVFGNDIRLAPTDTIGLTPTSISVDPALNTLTITWPDLNTTTPEVIAVDVDATVVNNPFADGLFLTNIFEATTENTAGIQALSNTPVQLLIGAPDLTITKGISALTNSSGVIAPPPALLPVDGDATGLDAGDQVEYTATIENLGRSPAFDVVITDTTPAGLTACVLISVENGLGAPLATAGDLFGAGLLLTNPLQGNDGTPGAPFADDTALVTYRCDVDISVEPNSTITNTASVVWASESGAIDFPPQTDDASISTTQAEAFKSITATSEGFTSDVASPRRVTIGEIVRYRISALIPEGTITNLEVRDILPSGLTALDDGTARAAFVSDNGGMTSSAVVLVNAPGSTNSVPTGALTSPITAAGAPFTNGEDPAFLLGTVVNPDNDTNDEFVVIEFNAIVNNTAAGSNDAGDNRNNRSRVFVNGGQVGQSPNVGVRVVEPRITMSKTASPTAGDAGDTISYSIVATSGGGNSSNAFEVQILDTLPADLINVSVDSITPAGCAVPGIVDNSLGNVVDIDVAMMEPGCSVTVAISAELAAGVAPGAQVNNTVQALWSSLPLNGTVGNPTGSVVPGAPGSGTGERNGSGGINDYNANDNALVTIASVVLAKAVVATSEPSTGTAEGNALLEDLAIGETADFLVTATIPEGTVPQVVISDTLPFTSGVMEVVSATVETVGANLTPTIAVPIPTITDTQLADGVDDTVSFDFGQVINAADGVSNADDQITVRIVARLIDVVANANTDTLTNSALVQFGPGLNASANASVDVVEPLLNVVKSSVSTQGDAGDTVVFTIDVSHVAASRSDAHDVLLTDSLPLGLTLVPGSLTLNSGLPPTSITEVGNGISVLWTLFGQADTAQIQFSATIDNLVMPTQVLSNVADLAWTSLPGADANERSFSDSDNHNVTVTSPGLVKQVVATSEADTGTGQFGPPTDLTIGERATYQFTVALPEGTTNSAEVIDQLPTGSSILAVDSARIVSIGANLSGVGLPPVGDPGVFSDTNADTFNDRVVWTLGDLQNAPDGVANADDNIVFEVIALVVDQPLNQSGVVSQTNTATLNTASSTNSGTVDVDIVAPALSITKTVTDPASGFVDAGDTVTHQLVITHTGSSTADAYNVIITDTLPGPDLSWVGDGSVVSDCPGLITNSAGEPVIAFSMSQLPLAAGSCTITYNTLVENTAQPTQTLTNTAVMDYDSTPVFVAGETRRLNDSDADNVTVLAPMLVKLTAMSSVADTGMSVGDPALPDLTIGETIVYEISLVVPEGTTSNAVVTDLMPANPAVGIMEVIGASVTSVGANLSTTLPGTPVSDDFQLVDGINDRVIFDFGTILNLPDGVSDVNDRITIEVVGRVVDVPANADGDLLVNNADFSFTGGNLGDTADVEVVEPSLNITKSLGPVTDGVVRVSIAVENTGTAPAYDISVSDVLSDTTWDATGFTQISVSAGFDLGLAAVPGSTTVTFSSDPLAVSPAGTIPAGSTVSAVFDVPLASLPPTPNPVVNQADLDASDTLPGNDPTARTLPTDSDTDTIGVPNLVVSKDDALLIDADTSTDVSPGDTLRYTLTVENNGAAQATNVVLDDAPDTNTTLVVGSVTTSQGSVTIGNTAGDNTVQIDMGSVAATATITITYDVLINDPLPTGVTQVVNQAIVDSTELPPVPSDDPTPPGGDDPTVVPVNAAPDLVIVKDDGGISAAPTGVIPYVLSYQNVGNQDAIGVVITETVPANTVFNAVSSSPGWVCVPDNNPGATCTLNVGNLAGGAVGSSTFAVMVDSPLAAGVTEVLNGASIADDGSNGPDPTPADNSDSDNTPLIAMPDLTITKDDGDISTVPGGTVVYTLSYQNVGNQDATGVAITETVPANTTFAPGSSAPGWACAPDNNAGSACTLNLGSVASGASGALGFAVIVDNPLAAGVNNLVNNTSIADDGTGGPDPTPGNNSDNDTTPVVATPDLVIAKDDGGITTAPGNTVVYGITFSNVGNQTATGVVITETVPVGSTFNAGASTPGWACVPSNAAGSSCSLAIGSVAGAGAGGAANFAVTVDNPLAAGIDQLVNTTSIGDDGNNGADPTPGNNSAGDNTPVIATPDLQITKDDGGITAQPGDTVAYTLNYLNVGDQAASGVSISETVPANTTFNPGASTAGWACVPSNAAGSSCTLAIGTVAGGGAGGSVTFAVTLDDPIAAAVTQISNTAVIGDDGNNGVDPTPGDNSDSDNTPVDAQPDLTITKDDGGVTVNPGDVLTYVLNYQNVGNQEATGVVISETVPANTVFNAGASTAGWSCAPDNNPGSSCTLNLGTVNGGASGSVNFALNVDNPLASGVTEVLNSASIADDGNNGADPTPGNNSDNDNTPVDAQPDLTITKDDGGISTVPGGVVVYTLNYQNVGNQNATGVVVTETVPANSVFNAGASSAAWACVPDGNAGSTCSLPLGAVTAGTGGSLSFAVTVDNPLAAGVDMLLNNTSIGDDGANGPDPTPGDNSASDNTPVVATPDLQITKDDGGVTAQPGDTVTYVLNYQNVGDQNATGVVITETVPVGSSFNAGASTAGWVCVPDNSAGSSCSLAIGTVNGAGGSGSANFAVTVDNPLAAGIDELLNTANIADDGNNGVDPTPGDNSDSDNTPLNAQPDLNIVKDDAGITAQPGDTVVYVLNYQNVGNQNATGVSISETVPANTVFNAGASTAGWSCTPDNNPGASCTLNIGALAAGASGSANFAVTLDDPIAAAVDEILNTASIGDDGNNGVDPTPGDNSDGDNTPVDAVPDLNIVKDDGGIGVAPGGLITYTLDYQNVGNQAATAVVINETVPTHTTFNAGSSSAGWSCAPDNSAGSSCTFALGTVAGGASGSVSFAVDVDDPLPAGITEVVNNTSIVDDGNNGPDPTPGDNDDSDNTPVGAFPDLRITKDDGDASVQPGGIVVYTLSYENVGDQDATGVFITDTVPANTSFLAASSSAGWTCVPDVTAGSSCTINIGNLDVGDTGSVDFGVVVDAPLTLGITEIVNNASIADDGSNGPDITPSDNDDGDTTPISLNAPVGLKVGNVTSLGVITWEMWWFNNNNESDLATLVIDEIPAGTEFIPGTIECIADGTSQCVNSTFNAALNRIEVEVIIAPDFTAPDNSMPDELNNEVLIRFQTRARNSGIFENQAQANWDGGNDGSPVDDQNGGQAPVMTDDPVTIDVPGDPTAVGLALEIPTLSRWGMLIMLLLMGFAVRPYLRRAHA
jgi:uncharacterized repeat protein (TIGR01451 family)